MHYKKDTSQFLLEPALTTDQQKKEGSLPLVSIACITYNHENYIRKTIEGFLIQETIFPLEILIHDDASEDRTAQVINEYEKKFPQLISGIYQKENVFSQGFNPFVTFLIPRIQSKYIAICEGDDYWVDQLKLQKQIDFLENNKEYSACFTNAIVSDEINDTSYPYVTFLKEGDVPLESIIKIGGGLYPTASLIVRTDVIKNDIFNDLIKDMSGDTSLIISAGMHGKVFFLNQITTVYRRWAGGMFSKISKDPQSIADWKLKRINGFKKLKKIANKDLKKTIEQKISLESLYILLNSSNINRFLYSFNLTIPDLKTFLISYTKRTLKLLANPIKFFSKK